VDRENDKVVDGGKGDECCEICTVGGEILRVDRNNDAKDVEIRDEDSSTKGGRVRCIEEDDG
jgi:hypothetical protein